MTDLFDSNVELHGTVGALEVDATLAWPRYSMRHRLLSHEVNGTIR